MRFSAPWIVVIASVCGGCTAHSTPDSRSPHAVEQATRGNDPPPHLTLTSGPTELPSVANLEHAFEQAAKVIAPAVVSITSQRHLGEDLPPFLRPFGPPDGQVEGMGAGVIIDAAGYVLTNNHVVAGADNLVVELSDDREFAAEIIGTDPKTDLAVIRIEAEGLAAATLGDSDRLRVGQWVLAAGSPFGLPRSVTAGIVSAVGRGAMGIADYGDFIQTDAAINQGNSGGPLIDLSGRVVGVNTAIASRTGGSNGIGFSIPVNLAKMVVEQLVDHGIVRRGWLGVVMGELEPDLAASFGYTGKHGILIDDVDPSGPAARAGMRAGDIVTELEGRAVRDMVTFRNAVAQGLPGAVARVTVFRGGATRELQVTLGTLPGDPETARPRVRDRPVRAPAKPSLGLRFGEPSAVMRSKMKLPAGRGAVVLEVARGSLADGADLRVGDVLLEVNGTPVSSPQVAEKLLTNADARRGVLVRLQRGRFGHFAVIRAKP